MYQISAFTVVLAPTRVQIYVNSGVSPLFRSHQTPYKWCPRGVMVKAMDCGIVVSEFVLQSCYYVHFRANTLEKGMNPIILQTIG